MGPGRTCTACQFMKHLHAAVPLSSRRQQGHQGPEQERTSPGPQRRRIHLLCRRCRTRGFDPRVGKIPWRRAWQPTPVLLPGESHGQRGLAGCSPWGHRVRARVHTDLTNRHSGWGTGSSSLPTPPLTLTTQSRPQQRLRLFFHNFWFFKKRKQSQSLFIY